MTPEYRKLVLKYIENTQSSELIYEGPAPDYDAADHVKPLKGVRIA